MYLIIKFLWYFLSKLNIDNANGSTLLFVGLFSILLIYILYLIIKGYMKLYKKFNKPTFIAFIPIINTIGLMNISGVGFYWFFVIMFRFFYELLDYYLVIHIDFLSFASIVISYFGYAAISYNLAKKFHKDESWLFGAIILSSIMWALLGSDENSVLDANVVVSKKSYLDKNKTVNNTQVTNSNSSNIPVVNNTQVMNNNIETLDESN